MNTKSFVNQSNQITQALFFIISMQMERIHQSVQGLSTEINTDEILQPLLNVLLQ